MYFTEYSKVFIRVIRCRSPCVIQAQIRRPTIYGFDKLDFDLGQVLILAHEFLTSHGLHLTIPENKDRDSNRNVIRDSYVCYAF